jgi:hypothetical protein
MLSYTIFNPVLGKTLAELELLLNPKVWDYVKPNVEKSRKK